MATDTPPEMSRVTIHMACSLDGFIAKHDGDMGWFETADSYDKGQDYGDVAAFLASIDRYVMGSNTYELALELGWLYGDTPTTVLTSRQLPKVKETVDFYSGDLRELVTGQLRRKYRNIWVVGGAKVAAEFIRLGLGDDLRLSILPVTLGDGMPLLGGDARQQALHLKDVTPYKNGVIELWYEIRKQ